MIFFGSKITLCHCFLPKNHCWAQFGQDLSGDPDGDNSCGALCIRNYPRLIPSLMVSRFLWDFCKIPQKSSFFVILGWRRRSSPAQRSPRSKFYFTISEDFNQFYY